MGQKSERAGLEGSWGWRRRKFELVEISVHRSLVALRARQHHVLGSGTDLEGFWMVPFSNFERPQKLLRSSDSTTQRRNCLTKQRGKFPC